MAYPYFSTPHHVTALLGQACDAAAYTFPSHFITPSKPQVTITYRWTTDLGTQRERQLKRLGFVLSYTGFFYNLVRPPSCVRLRTQVCVYPVITKTVTSAVPPQRGTHEASPPPPIFPKPSSPFWGRARITATPPYHIKL